MLRKGLGGQLTGAPRALSIAGGADMLLSYAPDWAQLPGATGWQ